FAWWDRRRKSTHRRWCDFEWTSSSPSSLPGNPDMPNGTTASGSSPHKRLQARAAEWLEPTELQLMAQGPKALEPVLVRAAFAARAEGAMQCRLRSSPCRLAVPQVSLQPRV